jgi:hypothetical protein
MEKTEKDGENNVTIRNITQNDTIHKIIQFKG